VKYTESENIEADMMTKNVVSILLIRHRNHVRNGAMVCYKNWDDVIINAWREDVKI